MFHIFIIIIFFKSIGISSHIKSLTLHPLVRIIILFILKGFLLLLSLQSCFSKIKFNYFSYAFFYSLSFYSLSFLFYSSLSLSIYSFASLSFSKRSAFSFSYYTNFYEFLLISALFLSSDFFAGYPPPDNKPSKIALSSALTPTLRANSSLLTSIN